MTTSQGVASASPSVELAFTPRRPMPIDSPMSDPPALRATAPTSARSPDWAIAGTSARPTQPVAPARMMRSVIGRRSLEERLDAGLRAPEDQRVHVVRALVGIDGLKVLRMAHDVVLFLDAVAAVHVAGDSGDIERLAAVVALDQGDHLGRRFALVQEAADAQRSLQAEGDLGLHVGELFLHELGGRQRPAELLALEHVGPRP